MDDRPLKRESAIHWLRECARYFEKRDTGGEDRAHWANVYNAEMARRIADMLERDCKNISQTRA